MFANTGMFNIDITVHDTGTHQLLWSSDDFYRGTFMEHIVWLRSQVMNHLNWTHVCLPFISMAPLSMTPLSMTHALAILVLSSHRKIELYV